MQYPELVDETRLDELVRDAKHPQSSSIDVLEIAHDDAIRWERNLGDDALADLFSVQTAAKLRIFFLKVNSRKWFTASGNIKVSLKGIKLLKEKGGISPLLLTRIYEDGHWSKMGDAFFIRQGNPPRAKTFEMHYRPHCGWNTGFSLMQMSSDGSTATYFYVNCAETVLSRLQNMLERNPGLSGRLFLLDILVVDDLLKQWSEIVHRRRGILVEYEQRTQKHDHDLLTRNLHELSRDWHVLLQDLTDTEEQIHFLETSYRRFSEVFIRSDSVSSEEQVPSVFTHAADGSLSYLKSRCSMYRRWTSNYKDRTNIQINLMFHLSNQNEARTNLRIARSTGKVAKQTQRDSASMITIAAVTMFFLPVTSVSAILSTIFFDYGETKINTSRQWWIFPAAVVPLTIVVFMIWWAWLKWREHRDAAEADDEGEEARKE